MIIALLQLDARLGDAEGNARRIEAAYADAVGQGAQLVLAPVVQAGWVEVSELDETARGEGGFGSTGGVVAL